MPDVIRTPDARALPRRRGAALGALAAGLALTVLAACDTDDGRAMREPTEEQRMRATTTSTTTTTTPSSVVAVDTAPATPETTDPINIFRPAAPTGDSGSSSTMAVTTVVTTTVPGQQARPAGAFTIAAPWADNGAIPDEHTCTGGDLTPRITWSAVPAGTAEIAILFTRVDDDGLLWAVSGLDSQMGILPAGSVPDGLLVGVNSQGVMGYGGPCPDIGQTLDYELTVYAVDSTIQVADPASTVAWRQALEGHILASDTVFGQATGR